MIKWLVDVNPNNLNSDNNRFYGQCSLFTFVKIEWWNFTSNTNQKEIHKTCVHRTKWNKKRTAHCSTDSVWLTVLRTSSTSISCVLYRRHTLTHQLSIHFRLHAVSQQRCTIHIRLSMFETIVLLLLLFWFLCCQFTCKQCYTFGNINKIHAFRGLKHCFFCSTMVEKNANYSLNLTQLTNIICGASLF